MGRVETILRRVFKTVFGDEYLFQRPGVPDPVEPPIPAKIAFSEKSYKNIVALTEANGHATPKETVTIALGLYEFITFVESRNGRILVDLHGEQVDIRDIVARGLGRTYKAPKVSPKPNVLRDEVTRDHKLDDDDLDDDEYDEEDQEIFDQLYKDWIAANLQGNLTDRQIKEFADRAAEFDMSLLELDRQSLEDVDDE
jgi:hypothetical protein